jgi:Zn ribbon nucleic-acid-binding protein
MKRRFSTRIITCIATSAVLAVGTLSFTVISAIADEAVSYYGLSADGTVISGTVTDYTKIASTDTAWGTAGKETWYVADGIVNIITTTYDYDNNKNVYNPVEIKGNVNVILKNNAEVSVVNGIAGTDATITFYSESENASGVIGFIGATGDDGGWGTTESGPDEANGKNGEDGKDAVNVLSFTVAGGTVTVIGGDGGKGGDAGYGTDYDTNESYYGIGGNGGNGSVAITDNTKVYLNGGRLNVTAGRGGNPGTNTHVPSEQQDNYNGKPGNNGTSVSGIYAVNGILNVNKLDDSDAADTSGDFKLLSVNGYENAKLDIIGKGTAKVADGTVIETYGDISVAGTLSVDNGTILTNGSITKSGSAAQITKTNGGIIRRFTPAYGAGYTLDYASGKCIAETGYKIKLSDGNALTDVADAYTIVSESNRLNIVRIGDGEIIDDSEPCVNVMPYCIKANNTNETTVTDGNVFAMRGVSSRLVFALNDPDEYRFSGVTVTDADGNALPDDMYTFDSTTGEFIALSVDRNLIVTADASLKDVEISVTDSENNPVSTVDIGTDFDNGSTATPLMFKLKVTEGGSIAKYRVVKESDLNKASGAITDTSSFTVSYTAGNEWGTADDGSSKIEKGETATFTVKPDSNLAAGTYTEAFIVITDRTAYADASAGTQDKALARFTLTYKVEHESDGKLYYSDLTGHYNLCKNCQIKINKVNHIFDIKTVNENTLAVPADCVNPAKYFYSCECGAHTNDTALVFENGDPNGHKFGEWKASKSADCTTGGKEKHICSVCKAEEERDTAPLGHDWNAEYTIDVKPTCTQPGSKSIHCSRCDATKDVTEIEPTGHSFGEWTVSKDSTCVAGGQKTRKCEICGYTEYEDTDIDSNAHEWEENYTIDKEPTCTTEGSKSIHCSRCDAKKDSTVIPVTDHTYGEWEVVTPSTCTENGVKKHACIHCGFEQTEIIEPAHEWEDSRTVDIAPSCTEQGEDSVHCRNCDERKDIKEISPKGHDWSEWKTLVEPTITSEGKEYRSCNVCGIKEEKALPKLSGKKEWKHDENKHWHVDDNGNIIDVDDHEFKWVVDKEPTATEPGIGHYECIACAFEKAPEEFGKRNPETGASSLAAWIAVAAVAGGAVPVTYKARKRKNK